MATTKEERMVSDEEHGPHDLRGDGTERAYEVLGPGETTCASGQGEAKRGAEVGRGDVRPTDEALAYRPQPSKCGQEGARFRADEPFQCDKGEACRHGSVEDRPGHGAVPAGRRLFRHRDETGTDHPEESLIGHGRDATQTLEADRPGERCETLRVGRGRAAELRREEKIIKGVMKMLMTIKGFESRYEEIMRDPSIRQRELRLGELMTEMEGIFKIPMLKNTAWEKENPQVIELYRKVSDSRNL